MKEGTRVYVKNTRTQGVIKKRNGRDYRVQLDGQANLKWMTDTEITSVISTNSNEPVVTKNKQTTKEPKNVTKMLDTHMLNLSIQSFNKQTQLKTPDEPEMQSANMEESLLTHDLKIAEMRTPPKTPPKSPYSTEQEDQVLEYGCDLIHTLSEVVKDINVRMSNIQSDLQILTILVQTSLLTQGKTDEHATLRAFPSRAVFIATVCTLLLTLCIYLYATDFFILSSVWCWYTSRIALWTRDIYQSIYIDVDVLYIAGKSTFSWLYIKSSALASTLCNYFRYCLVELLTRTSQFLEILKDLIESHDTTVETWSTYDTVVNTVVETVVYWVFYG